jgi:diguanylate cyclase (GGDEF)-like protein
MIAPATPPNERQRLATLRSLKLLDTPPEERFDRITRLARNVFGVPIALVTLVDAERQWFKSNQGLKGRETPRSISFCGHTILQDHPMVVEDARTDDRFSDNPSVTGDPNVRFYAGYPLSAPDGSKLGSLCIIDRKPRKLSDTERETLVTLGRLIESELASMNLATSDALTGVSNLRGFAEIGQYVLALATRLNHGVELLYLDVEGFGAFNERHGREEGDRLLIELAQLLLASFRDSDLVGRVGRDEFAVLLSGATETIRNQALRRLEVELDRLNMLRPLECRFTVKLSAVTYDPVQHPSLEVLVHEAEQRLRG